MIFLFCSSLFESKQVFYPSGLSHIRFLMHILYLTWLSMRIEIYLLEFQFLFQAVQAKKGGCIGNYPFLHFAVAIEVRSCPMSVIQVCCPIQTNMYSQTLKSILFTRSIFFSFLILWVEYSYMFIKWYNFFFFFNNNYL